MTLRSAASPPRSRSSSSPSPRRCPPSRRRSRPAAEARERLPAAVTTRHALALPEGTVEVEATAGAVVLEGAGGAAEAEIAFVAYTLPGADPATRPVTFAVNGGPGAASAYLNIGAIGPWRLPMDPGGPVPSQDVTLVPNAETWLPFTDLVFVDPVGTGFSRLIEADDAKRGRFLAIEGDVEAMAQVVRRWLVENGRVASPRYFVGESYGGFRGPLVAEALREDEGLALDGLVLVSPVLDFGWWSQAEHTPWPAVALLPSLAAAEMEAEGRFSEAALAAAEAYAAGDYVADLLRGVGDGAAVGRIVERVTALTGLDRAVVAETAGRIDAGDFARAAGRAAGRRMSVYDAAVLGARAAAGAAAAAATRCSTHDGAADGGDAGALPRHARLGAGPALPAPEPGGERRPGTGTPGAGSPRRSGRSPRRWRSTGSCGCWWRTGRPTSSRPTSPVRADPAAAAGVRTPASGCGSRSIAAGTCSTCATTRGRRSATTPGRSTPAGAGRHGTIR